MSDQPTSGTSDVAADVAARVMELHYAGSITPYSVAQLVASAIAGLEERAAYAEAGSQYACKTNSELSASLFRSNFDRGKLAQALYDIASKSPGGLPALLDAEQAALVSAILKGMPQ